MDCNHKIAVVGLGAVVPGALDVPTFWSQQLAGRSEIGMVPREIWDTDVFYDPMRRESQKSYTKLGAVVRGFGFDPREFGLPPALLPELDMSQKGSLVAARQALADAGIHGPTDGLRAAVLLGNLQGGTQLRSRGWFRTSYPALELTVRNLPALRGLPQSTRERIERELCAAWRDQFPAINSDTLPGLLGNMAAARIAHHYNFHGPASVVDAACASSLAAVESAVQGLSSGRFDLAVTGGADFLMDIGTYVGFCAMGALSAEGSFPFDRRASGFVMGEGAVAFVLERLEDAERNGRHIYALIRGVGSSSDGRDRSIVAPSAEGQRRAMSAAWREAGVAPSKAGYLEAHGTATAIGDPTEVFALRQTFGEAPLGSIPMGSVKGNVGHLKAAAGAAGMLRAVLVLNEAQVPPQANFAEANPSCEFEKTPLRIPTSPEPFAGQYAGVSAFGFGGVNYHVVLESVRARPLPHPARRASVSVPRQAEPPLGLGIIAFGGATREEVARLARSYQERADDPVTLARELAASPALKAAPCRAAFFSETAADARLLLEALAGDSSAARLESMGVSYREGPTFAAENVAFMFPGQGSQYLWMLDELRARFPIVQATLDEADAVMAGVLPRKLTEYITPGRDRDEGQCNFELLQTEVLQPAILAADEALRRLLAPIVTPKIVFGHSLGEYAACVAAGVMRFPDALRLVAARGEATAKIALEDNGLMLGVGSDSAKVERALEGVEGYVVVVNRNCRAQTIIGGTSAGIQAANVKLRADGFQTMFLPVSHAFHSAIVAPASEPLRQELEKIEICAPKTKILSNVTANYYPSNGDAVEWIRATLSRQLASPVEFIDMVERAYADGARVFVEIGPKRAQAGFVGNILKGRPHRAVHVCHPKLGELATLGRTVAALVADGVVSYGTATSARAAAPEAPDWIEPRTPWVGRIASPPEEELPAAAAPPVSPSAAVEAALSEGSFGVLDGVAKDPRFWQFIAAQGPAIASYLAASFRAASALAGPPLHTPAVPSLVVSARAAANGSAKAAGPSWLATAEAPAPALPVDWSRWVRERIAEKTGYSFAELDLDANLETELGIDSIRQLEIVLSIRNSLELAPDDGFKMADYPTLRSLVSYVQQRTLGRSNGAAANGHANGHGAPANGTSASRNDAAAKGNGSGTAVNGNGKHAHDGKAQDVTSWLLARVAEKTGYTPEELDLDANIEGELGIDSIRQIEMLLSIRDALKLPPDDGFKPSEYPTLRRLSAYLEAHVDRTKPLPFDVAWPASNAAPGVTALLAAPNFVRQVVLERAPDPAHLELLEPIVVLHRNAPASRLSAIGGVALSLTNASEASLEESFTKLRPRTLVDLTALEPVGATAADAADEALRGVFRAARALFAAKVPCERVLVATAMGGALAMVPGGGDPTWIAAGGSTSGAWKSAAREGLAKIELTIADLASVEDISALCGELAPSGCLEVALGGGERRVPVLRAGVQSTEPLTLDASSVVFVLGGARGIAARVALELARRYRCRLLLAGRTRPAPSREFDRARVRTELRERFGGDLRALNDAVSEREREADVAATLESVRAAGAEAHAVTLDARDALQVERALESARERFGRLDLIIHAAGIDRSRALATKTEPELSEVLAPKLAPLEAILRAARGARVVAFGSVSARFGNAGQIDYAAANESLARQVVAAGGCVLDFSAWADVGMAAPLTAAIRERGVDLLAADEAASATVTTIASGALGEWVLAGRLAQTGLGGAVLGGTVAAHVPNAEIEQRATLVFEERTWLRDHRAVNAGLMPGVVGLEVLAEAASSLAPGLALTGYRDVSFSKPLKVFPGQPVDVIARARRGAANGALEVGATLCTASGTHHEGRVLLAGSVAKPASFGAIPPDPGPAHDEIYRTFFHGPSFRVLATTAVNGASTWGRSVALEPALGEGIPGASRTRALAREVALQTAGVHLLTRFREAALPLGFAAIDVHSSAKPGERVEALATLRAREGDISTFDVTLRGEDQRSLETYRGVTFRRLASL
jgi:acyl transferase domain-containing protein/acyl carrier protein/NAD(P)-dependent dehydrogenase (short-subunit alcohol dehydrogenase family)